MYYILYNSNCTKIDIEDTNCFWRSNDLQTSGVTWKGEYLWWNRLAGLEINVMPTWQLGDGLHGALSGCKEFRKIFLFPSYFSIHCTARTTSSYGYSRWLNGRDLVFHHSEMVQASGADCLVCSRDPMLFLTLRLFRQHHHVLLT